MVARTRELRADLRGGNPVDGYVTMLTESRQDAVGRLVEMAEAAGADAVVGLRFDCSEITQSLSEVAAYGTAVALVPVPGEEEPADDPDKTEATPDPARRGDQRTASGRRARGRRAADRPFLSTPPAVRRQ